MRKIIYSLIAISLLCIIVFINYEFKPLENKDPEPTVNSDNGMMNQEPESPSITTVTGYFFFDYVDIRERLAGDEEEEYYYYMDRYFQTYSFELITPTEDTDEKTDTGDDYEDYFKERGMDILSLPNKLTNKDGLFFKNGDYISVEIEGPIMESFPAQAKITKVERIATRTVYR